MPPSLHPAPPPATAPSSGSRLRVCHVSMTLQTGGLERLLVDFGRFHDASRFELRFAALDLLGAPADDLRRMGFEVESLGLSAAGKRAVVRRLSRLLREERIDILHTHNTYAHFYGALAALRGGTPIVVNTQHGRGCGDGWKDRLQFRIANRWTGRIVGVSEDAANLCRAQDRWSAHKTTRIWNGIDLERFAWRGPAAEPVAISVARLSPVKDFPTLLRSVAIAVREVPEFRLKLVGDGPERQRLEALSRELGLERVVEFLGERSDVPDLLATAGFYISSSRTEGISLTLLEAMAVGLPVLATSVGGSPEIVVDGQTGRLAPPADPPALAAGIVAMCRDRDLWPSMGTIGRRRVEENFEIRGMVRAYEDIYQQLAKTVS